MEPRGAIARAGLVLLVAGLSACVVTPPPTGTLGSSPAPRATASSKPSASAPAEPRPVGPMDGKSDASPTPEPVATATAAATASPTSIPSMAPTASPTAGPTATPTPAPTATPTPVATPTPSRAAFAPPADLAAFTARYGLPVDAATGPVSVPISGGNITAIAPDATRLLAYQAMLPGEFGLYPPDLVTKSGLTRLVLCENLAFGGQTRAAVPDPRNNALYLDVAPASPEYRRAVLHHEYFHMVDFKDDGQLYADGTWAALNRAGFAYDRGGVYRQGQNDQFGLVGDEPGFLTYYATSGVEEDKAETFCFLMLYPKEMDRRAGEDAVFAAKLARMKTLLKAFVPAFDEAYWQALADHRKQ